MAGRKLALLAVLVMIAAAVPVHATPVNHLLITAVYYDTYVSFEGDEFIRITNPTASAVNLASMRLTDGEGIVEFPTGASILPGQTIFVTDVATDFVKDMIFKPDWEFRSDSDPTVPNLIKISGNLTLANGGDEVRLLAADHVTVIDAVIYGTSPGSAGWTGAAIPGVSEGKILERDSDEVTGDYVDSDTAADWDDARVYVVGQSHFPLQAFTASKAQAFSSPDSSFAVAKKFLDTASSSLDINLYEITNPYIGDRIVAAAQRGVAIRVLMEGGPAGFAQADRYQENSILAAIQAAGADVRFIITNDTLGIHDRYTFDHAKYAIADHTRVLAMSGNWKETGLPTDPTYGNREWGVIVDSSGLAGYVGMVFAGDFDNAHRDILPFGGTAQNTDWRYQAPPPGFVQNRSVTHGPYGDYFPTRSFDGPFQVTPVLTPDTSLLEFSSLRNVIRNAQSEVLIEQMYAHQHWGSPSGDTAATAPNLYLEDAITAARHGAKLRVLLGDEFIDYEDTRNNYDTVTYLRDIATNEGLDIQARIVNSKIAEIVKIHNKGVVVDGQVAVVSSINWGENSAKGNRELALMIDHSGLAQFYRDLFWYDWEPAAFKPLTDLVVEGAILHATPLLTAGPVEVDHPAQYTLDVTVANVGGYGAGDFNVTVHIAPTLFGSAFDFQGRLDHLPAGETYTFSFPLAGRLMAGTFHVTAIVDADNEVQETIESNNDLAQDVTAQASIPGIETANPAPPLPTPPALPTLPPA